MVRIVSMRSQRVSVVSVPTVELSRSRVSRKCRQAALPSLCTYQRPSHRGGRRVTPGTYGRIARDLLTFFANTWHGTGALDRFCTSEARYTGKDPRDWVYCIVNTGRTKCMFVEIVILWLTRYKAKPHCVQKNRWTNYFCLLYILLFNFY